MIKKLTIEVTAETKLALKAEAKRKNLTVSQLVTLLFFKIIAEEDSNT